MRLALAALIACAVPPPPPKTIAPPPPKPVRVTLEASGAASRGYGSARSLRRLIASRHGDVELAVGSPEVTLQVTRVISGQLDDPDYANRPVGVNALPVILVGDAAFERPDDLEGFAGTWTLTRLPDGTLIADAMPNQAKTDREALRAQIRASLRGGTAELHRTGLELLVLHRFYEFVPDVIALLDDTRVPADPPGRRSPMMMTIRQRAGTLLASMTAPLGLPPPVAESKAAWMKYWQDLLATQLEPAPIKTGKQATIAALAMAQAWPQLVATGDTVYAAVSRLETPLDGHDAGVFRVKPPWNQRDWVATDRREGLDASGAHVLTARDDPWMIDDVPIKSAGTHAAIAGEVVVTIRDGERSLFIQDSAGNVHTVALPGEPNTRYHRGIHPVSIAKKPGGWLVAVEVGHDVVLAVLDDKLALVETRMLARIDEAAQPAVIVDGDRAIVAWTDRGHLYTVITHLDGRMTGKPIESGTDVSLASRPIAIPNGYAIAWIEDGRELHVARWDHESASDVVLTRTATAFALALTREAVVYMDGGRYPFQLVARGW